MIQKATSDSAGKTDQKDSSPHNKDKEMETSPKRKRKLKQSTVESLVLPGG